MPANGKSTHVVSSAMPKTEDRQGQKSVRFTVAPVRLDRNVGGQSKKGLGKPHP